MPYFVKNNEKIYENYHLKAADRIISFIIDFNFIGLKFSKDYEGESKIYSKKIKFIPLWKWLLQDSNKSL